MAKSPKPTPATKPHDGMLTHKPAHKPSMGGRKPGGKGC